MKLLEFITYCQLKGLVQEHHKMAQPWDVKVGYHYRIAIISEDTRKRLTIIYTVLHDTGVMVSHSLYQFDRDKHLQHNLNLSDIVKEFIPE